MIATYWVFIAFVTGLALGAAAIWRWSEVVLLLIASSYTAIGVTLHVVRLLRHRLVSRTA